jgi:hypothetical protein
MFVPVQAQKEIFCQGIVARKSKNLLMFVQTAALFERNFQIK